MQEAILLVDDHDSVRRSLSRWLEKMFPSCLFLTATSGEQAVSVVRDTLPRVVIMDFGLPGMNGVEATRRIKAIVPATQVIILTIHNSVAYRVDAADAGASAYILKDEMQTQLVPVLEALLVGEDLKVSSLSVDRV
jgi:DNA-binding NarL/FixJ family response regulator